MPELRLHALWYKQGSAAEVKQTTFFFLMAWSYAPCKARFFSLTVMFSFPSSSRSNTCTGVTIAPSYPVLRHESMR